MDIQELLKSVGREVNAAIQAERVVAEQLLRKAEGDEPSDDAEGSAPPGGDAPPGGEASAPAGPPAGPPGAGAPAPVDMGGGPPPGAEGADAGGGQPSPEQLKAEYSSLPLDQLQAHVEAATAALQEATAGAAGGPPGAGAGPPPGGAPPGGAPPGPPPDAGMLKSLKDTQERLRKAEAKNAELAREQRAAVESLKTLEDRFNKVLNTPLRKAQVDLVPGNGGDPPVVVSRDAALGKLRKLVRDPLKKSDRDLINEAFMNKDTFDFSQLSHLLK